mgnify:CR=1 FL=1
MKKQINLRIDEIDLERLDDIRRKRTPIPNVTELIRDMIAETHEREVARPARTK